MPKRELHIVDGKIQVKPLPQDLKLAESGVIYVYKSNEGLIYKLHHCPDRPVARRWTWIMMNNSIGRGSDHSTMELAIKSIMNQGYVIYQMSMKEFCNL